MPDTCALAARHATKKMTLLETPPVVRWAWAGGTILLFIAYVFARWVLGGHAVPTDPGPDPLPSVTRHFILGIQVVTCLLGIAAITGFVILPWRREGRLTTVGMLYLCWLTLLFQDPMMNYSSVSLLYNSYMINLGAWTLSSTPGWMSPHGNNLPEPLLLIIVGYTIIGYSLCFPVIAVLRHVRRAWPGIAQYRLAVIGIIILIALDTLCESLLLRTGVYAYPGGIRAITLFAGHTYQFPMTEGICYGGLTTGSTMALLFYRDERGQTFVERGLDSLTVGPPRRQWIKFLALFGFVHISMFVAFTIPMQWLALHSDPFPKAYPSYMINGLCAYGANAHECPGPGVLMPRPGKSPS